MVTRIIIWLAHIVWKDNRRRKALYGFVFLVFLGPILFFSLYHTVVFEQNITKLTLQQREISAVSAAAVLNERLDAVQNFLVVFATHPKIRQLVSQKKWNEAIDLLQFFKPRFKEEFVDQIFLVDPSGIFVASDPPAPEVMDKNFAFRDWYKG
ncbi:MAG: hypothetical protein Q7K16_02690, partial [Candidatus Azambacteria bacterium]|nr:hypothetical protein [Candidatus Azambacteria bacterium]